LKTLPAPQPTALATSETIRSSQVAVSVRNASKQYRIYSNPQDRLLDHLLGFGRPRGRNFWALDDVSFDVTRGEILGIIGRNGSGKSTLLQILAGILKPTTGEVRIHGNIGALLELGSGFNPEYTGRENIYLNAALIGLSPNETNHRFDEICSFADIGEFLDQPIKTYSSGMVLRLAFAIQACLFPQILLVDEAIAVGDAAFQRKCYRRIEDFMQRGGTVILVSHDLNVIINTCTRAILLNQGRVVADGQPPTVCEEYQKLLFGEDIAATSSEYGDGGARFLDIWFENDRGERIGSAKTGSQFSFCYELRFAVRVTNPIFGLTIKSIQGVRLVSTNTDMQGINTGAYEVGDRVTVRWPLTCTFTPNHYFFSCGCSYADTDRFLARRIDAVKLTVVGHSSNVGLVDCLSPARIDRSTLPEPVAAPRA